MQRWIRECINVSRGFIMRMQRWTRECSNAELLSDLWVESCTAHKSCPAQCHCQPAGEKKVNRSTNKDHLASCLPGNTTACHWYIGKGERSTGQKMWTIVLPTKQMNACTMLQLCLCLLVRDRQEINDCGATEKGHRVNRSSLNVMNMSSCYLIL